MVSRRVESLRNPSGKSFEDHAPDGRWFRILRHRVSEGGAVTVNLGKKKFTRARESDFAPGASAALR